MEFELVGGTIVILSILSVLCNLAIIGGIYFLIKSLITHYKKGGIE